MALLAAAVLGAGVIGAGAGAYGSAQNAKAQKQTNNSSAAALAENRRINTANALQDAINSYANSRQQAMDNRRYDEAKTIEDKQRQLVNALSTATQIDARGNKLSFDASTNTWRASTEGQAAIDQARGQTLNARNYDQQLEQSTVGAQQGRDRRNQGSQLQGTQRALSQELLARYGANQGRDTESMQGALIEKNVADATDPLTSGGNMAMLQGYRQGNSGNDALMGSLARQSQGGTRSAIASARLNAPTESYNERDAAAKSMLAPATTLAERGSMGPGISSPTFNGDASSNLIASLSRVNPAGLGSTLNPRGGGNLQVRQQQGSTGTFAPLNASGNMAAGVSESLQSLLNNKTIQDFMRPSGSAFKAGGYGGMSAPMGYADTGSQMGDRTF